MEPRNYLEQAKSFLLGRGAKLALRVAPLALMAAGALHAGTITFTPVSGSVSCAGCTSGGFATGSANSQSITSGISFYGSGGVTGSTAPETLQFAYNGSASGSGPGTLNVSWDFSGTTSNIIPSIFEADSISRNIIAVPVYTYSLTFDINGSPVTCSTCSGIAAADGSTTTGSGTLAVPAGTVTSYSATFDFSFTPIDSYNSLNITIPQDSSIDVTNAAGVSGVPEPATLLLMVPGMGLLAFLKRRSRNAG